MNGPFQQSIPAKWNNTYNTCSFAASSYLDDVGGHEDVYFVLQMSLGVLLSNVLDGQLLGGHLVLLLQGLVIVLGQRQHLLHGVLQKKETKYFSGTERNEVVHFLG